MSEKKIKILDYFVPESVLRERGKALFDSRVISSLSIVVIFVSIFSSLLISFPVHVLMPLIGVGVIGSVAMLLLKYSVVSRKSTAKFLSMGITLVAIAISIGDEMFFTSTFSWFPVIACGSVFLTGLRFGGLISAMLMMTVIGVFLTFKDYGLTIPSSMTEVDFLLDNVNDHTLTIFVGFVIGVFYEVGRVRGERHLLEMQQKVISHQAASARKSKLAELGEMSAGVAHEINNPLMIISAAAEVITLTLSPADPGAKKILRMVKKIESTCERMSSITSALLIYSADSDNESYEKINIEKIFDEIKFIYQERTAFRNIKLTFSILTELEPVRARSTQIFQVLANLINNSLDSIENTDNKEIEVTAFSEAGMINICVRDSGQGITVELEKKIFRPFFTTKEIGKGTGLGLSFAFGTVKEHGGYIYVDRSQARTGVTFSLPICSDSVTKLAQ